MLQPPVSDLAPWRPGHWITDSGYALDAEDVVVGTKELPNQQKEMLRAVTNTNRILQKVMRK